MKNQSLLIYAAIGSLAVALLAAFLWLRPGKLTVIKPGLAHASNVSPLFDPRDRPITVVLKEVDSTSGKLIGTKAVIRQSKNRYNQIKQTLLAYLQGTWDGKSKGKEGLSLNEFYLTPQGLAVVDVSTAQLQPSSFGFYDEALFIKGLIESLNGNFFEVKAVKVLVDGQEALTIAGHYALGTADAGAPVSNLAAKYSAQQPDNDVLEMPEQ